MPQQRELLSMPWGDDGYFGIDAVQLHRDFAEGMISRMMKDEVRARAAFTAAARQACIVSGLR